MVSPPVESGYDLLPAIRFRHFTGRELFATIFAGTWRSRLPKRLIPYNPNQWALHDQLIGQRNEVYAHSDLERWTVRPWRSADFETTIVGQPILVLEPPQIEAFLEMTEPLMNAIRSRMDEIHGSHRNEGGPE